MPDQRPFYLGDDHQHLEDYMLVEHVSSSPRQSPVLQWHPGRAISHGVFHGRIWSTKMHKRPMPSRQIAIYCSPTRAQIDTKPQLEIYADDVKCTHGATIGQIEENACFTCVPAVSTRLRARACSRWPSPASAWNASGRAGAESGRHDRTGLPSTLLPEREYPPASATRAGAGRKSNEHPATMNFRRHRRPGRPV